MRCDSVVGGKCLWFVLVVSLVAGATASACAGADSPDEAVDATGSAPPTRIVAAAATSPTSATDAWPGSGLDDDDDWLLLDHNDRPSCDEFLAAGVYPGPRGTEKEQAQTEFAAQMLAISVYLDTWLSIAQADPWELGDELVLSNRERAEIADRISSLIDEDGLYCGLFPADLDQIEELRKPVPTLPPAGSVDEYTLWARSRCESVLDTLQAEQEEVSQLAECNEELAKSPDREGHACYIAHGALFEARALVASVESRTNVPDEAEELNEQMTRIATDLDAFAEGLIERVGATHHEQLAAEVDTAYSHAEAQCAEAMRLTDELRQTHVGR